MRSSGRTIWLGVLPLLLLVAACTDPVQNIEEPDEAETCASLVPVGIELVNDYFYTLLEADVGTGDPEELPTSLRALNARGADLDRRAAELECDLDELNEAIVSATSGLESTDPVAGVFLETVRGGVIGAGDLIGSWVLVAGTVNGSPLAPVEPITLEIDEDAASGSAGCNSYYYPVAPAAGEWVWAGGSATLTELLCADAEVSAVEEAYVKAFAAITAYAVEADELVLKGEGIELRYVRSP